MKIAGSDINIEHADIKGKNIQDLKKLDIFSHLSKEDQEKAYTELYNAANKNSKIIDIGFNTDEFNKQAKQNTDLLDKDK